MLLVFLVQYTRKRVAKLVTVRDGSRRPGHVGSRHVCDRASCSALMRMFVASLPRTRNIVTLFSPVYFVLLAGRHDPSRPDTTFGDPLRIGCIGHVCVFQYAVHNERF